MRDDLPHSGPSPCKVSRTTSKGLPLHFDAVQVVGKGPRIARRRWISWCVNSLLGPRFFFFLSGTVERASARPYYDKTQRMPHAQSDRDVAHLAMLTARIKGRELDTGCGFLSHRKFNKTQG
jgi:hypothetical protein